MGFHRTPPRRDVKRLAGPLNFVLSASRRLSRSSRTRARLEPGFARLITGIAAAALLFAAQTSDRLQRGPSVDAFHSTSPLAPLPLLHSVLSHRLALESRPLARSAHGLDAALPTLAQAIVVTDTAHHVAAVAPSPASASIAGRGYDATAPPALS